MPFNKKSKYMLHMISYANVTGIVHKHTIVCIILKLSIYYQIKITFMAKYNGLICPVDTMHATFIKLVICYIQKSILMYRNSCKNYDSKQDNKSRKQIKVHRSTMEYILLMNVLVLLRKSLFTSFSLNIIPFSLDVHKHRTGCCIPSGNILMEEKQFPDSQKTVLPRQAKNCSPQTGQKLFSPDRPKLFSQVV